MSRLGLWLYENTEIDEGKILCVFGCKEISFSACAISKGARLFFSTKSLFQSFSLCKICVRKQYFKTPAL